MKKRAIKRATEPLDSPRALSCQRRSRLILSRRLLPSTLPPISNPDVLPSRHLLSVLTVLLLYSCPSYFPFDGAHRTRHGAARARRVSTSLSICCTAWQNRESPAATRICVLIETESHPLKRERQDVAERDKSFETFPEFLITNRSVSCEKKKETVARNHSSLRLAYRHEEIHE